MKRIIAAALALATTIQIASAQQGNTKTPEAAKAAVEKAVGAVANPKTAAKPAAWVNVAKAYMDAYTAPTGVLMLGSSKQELALYGFKEKCRGTETVTVSGQPMAKEKYSGKNLYFNQNGQLVLIEVTKPLYPGCLDSAFVAMQKAQELDVKGTKKKDITALKKTILEKFQQEAYDAYNLQKIADASVYFEKAAIASEAEPASAIDSNSVYNAAFTAWMTGDIDRSKPLFERCLAISYYGEDGETYAKLAAIAEKQGDKQAQQAYLEEAFTKFPQSQSVLIGLINFYVSGNGSTDRIFELLDAAKVNEPNNASLYYVEGNINSQLGRIEAAAASYEKCSEINPNYEYGYIGEGQMYYNIAVEIQEKASNEMDDAKYMALVSDFEKALKSCIVPFEKAFDVTKDTSIKVAVAEYLKNACFRFRTDADYSGKYTKYNDYVAANKQ